jgi:hypothetical protein
METTNKITEVKTSIYRDMFYNNAWTAKTVRTEKGQTFEITTMKRYSGHLITSATKVDMRHDGDFISTSFGMNDGFMSLDHGKITVTEKAIRECHAKGLLEFDRLIKTLPESEVKKEEPEIGDILFLDGYGKSKGSSENKHIVYQIEETKWGTNYKTIEKDTLELSAKDYPKPYSKKFGIGTYFEKGYNMQSLGITENDLENMLIEAQDVAKVKAEQKRIADEKARKEANKRDEYLSQFVRADTRKTTATIKTYCKREFNISDIKVTTDKYSGGSSLTAKYTSPEKIDKLERFINSLQYGHFNGMEDIYEYTNEQDIIIDGFILEQYKYVFCEHQEGEGKKITPEQVAIIKPEWDAMQDFIKETDLKLKGIQIIDYSDKAIAVVGDTKPYKEDFKKLGGRFNFRLSCGDGWVFPKSKRSEIEDLFS